MYIPSDEDPRSVSAESNRPEFAVKVKVYTDRSRILAKTPRRLSWMGGDGSCMPMKLHAARLAVEARVPVSEAVGLPIGSPRVC